MSGINNLTMERAQNAFATSETVLRAIAEGKDANVINKSIDKISNNPFDTANVEVTDGKINKVLADLDSKIIKGKLKMDHIEGKLPESVTSGEIKNAYNVYEGI